MLTTATININKLANGLSWEAFVGTMLYSLLGMALLVVSVSVINVIFKLDVRKELMKDNNVAFGIAIAGMAIALAIIIAGTIGS